MIAQQSLECEAPASLWILDKIQTMHKARKNGTENQSGVGPPQSKVRPERLTEKVPAQPVKFRKINESAIQ